MAFGSCTVRALWANCRKRSSAPIRHCGEELMTTEDTLSADHRLSRLERSQKKLQGITALLALLVIALAAWQFLPTNPVIHARGFVLRDERRRDRAELTTWEDGTVVFRMNGKNEKARALWRLHPDGALSLKFADGDGDSRAELALDARGNPSLI